jgi:hypothetical protein
MQFKYIQESTAILSLTSADLRRISAALKASGQSFYDSDLEMAARQLAADHKIESSQLERHFELKDRVAL